MTEYLPTAVICAKRYMRSSHHISGSACTMPSGVLLQCIVQTHREFSEDQMSALVFQLKTLGHVTGSDNSTLLFNDSFCE